MSKILKTLKTGKTPLFIVGGLLLFIGIGYVFLFTTNHDSAKSNMPPLTVSPNPTPFAATDSPVLQDAQNKEIDLMKKRGMYFSAGDTKTKSDETPSVKEKENEKPEVVQQPEQVPEPERKFVDKNTESGLWKFFMSGNAAGAGTVINANAKDTSNNNKNIPTTEKGLFPFKIGCFFDVHTMNAVKAFVRKSQSIVFAVDGPNCANVPYGSTIIGNTQANYDTMRADVALQAVITPDGTRYAASGLVTGLDKMAGIGESVERNDINLATVTSLFSGTSAAFDAARQDTSQVSYNNGIYGGSPIVTQNKTASRTSEAAKAGISAAAANAGTAITGQMNRQSPIIVNIPDGLSARIMFTTGGTDVK